MKCNVAYYLAKTTTLWLIINPDFPQVIEKKDLYKNRKNLCIKCFTLRKKEALSTK